MPNNTEPTPLCDRGFTLVVEGEDGRTHTFLKGEDFGMEGRAEKVAVHLKDTVTAYLTEIEPLLSATDAGAELWREREFGEMEIRPPREHQRGGARVTVDGTSKQLRGPVPRPKKVELTGLVSLLNLPAPISANWTVETKSVGFQGTEQTREVVTATKEIPFNVTDEMYRAANGYLNELGLGPTLESTRIVNFSREPDGSRLNGDGDNE